MFGSLRGAKSLVRSPTLAYVPSSTNSWKLLNGLASSVRCVFGMVEWSELTH